MESLELALHETPPEQDEKSRYLSRVRNELRHWGKRVSDNVRHRWQARTLERPVERRAGEAVLEARPFDYLRYGPGVTLVALPDPNGCPGATIALEPTSGIPARCVSTSKTAMEGRREWLPAEGMFVSHQGVWRREVQQWHHESTNLWTSGDTCISGPLLAQRYTTSGPGSFLVSFDLNEMFDLSAMAGPGCISVDYTVYCIDTNTDINTGIGRMRKGGLYGRAATTGSGVLTLEDEQAETEVIGRSWFKDSEGSVPNIIVYSPSGDSVRCYVSQSTHIADPGGPIYHALTWIVQCQCTYAGVM